MAFSKAKIQRFNDINSCAPSPWAYNPKFKDPVVGAVISHSERFIDPKSPASTCSDNHSVHSANSVPTFRTPTKPATRKKIYPNNTDKNTSKSLFSPKKSEALREKIVECMNKDITIKELEGHIEELKITITNLKTEENKLKTQQQNLIEELEACKKIKEDVAKQLKEEYEGEIAKLKEEYVNMMVENKKQCETQLEELRKELGEEWGQKLKAQQEKADEILKECQSALKEEYNGVVNKVKEEYVNTMLENKKRCETQLEELRKGLEEEWGLKLKAQQDKADEILKECQSISEYSIIQCELEKNEIASYLKQEKENLESENIQLQEIISKLKTDMSCLIIELNQVREKLGKETQSHRAALEQNKIQQHNYEITLHKTHDTINALKKRLLDSDRDVEQLKLELQNVENNSLGNENKITDLEHKLELANTVKQSLEAQNSGLKFQLDHRVKTLENHLLEKIDVFQAKFNKENEELSKTVAHKSKKLEEIIVYLHEQQQTIDQAQKFLSEAENEMDKLKEEKTHLESQLASEELRITATQQNTIDNLRTQLQRRDEEVESLKKLVKDQNALIGPFREQLEHYERDYKTLLNDKQEAEQEMKEMSLKYAEILGHQNKKQKIKYMVDLKRKNLELQEAKSEYEAKLFKQSILIDNLKHEIRLLQHKNEQKQKRRSRSMITVENKENLCSPAKTQMNGSQVKVDSPLKDRN